MNALVYCSVLLMPGGLNQAREDAPPASIRVATLYDGIVPYALDPSGGYVRTGAEAEKRVRYNKEFSENDSSFGPFKRTREVIALHAAIHVRVKRDASPEEVWDAARSIVKWFRQHRKFDPDKYHDLMRAGRPPQKGNWLGDWPTIQQIANYYAEHQELVYEYCFSEAHMVFQLFRICGLPTEDFGIASAHYAKDKEGKVMREHVYIGLRAGGEWYYIDSSAKLPPPYAERASAGWKVGEGAGCDYAHPFLFKVVRGARFQAIPLLEARREPN